MSENRWQQGENRRVELLAPAGSTAALHAAVRAGADAVYLGMGAFNARRNADNFEGEALAAACDYAHMRGVKVYVTMNTAILPSEVDHALAEAERAVRAGVDAFIVQDLGLASALSRRFPEVRLHISTQMNTHSKAGIEAAALLGASRVTLAREMCLAEIAELVEEARSFDMEVECFAHGALCICYSGQCLMSSLIGGRSANRGLCAQACRLPYELRRGEAGADNAKSLPAPGEHLLSPQDLCSIDLLAQMLEAGVTSFKIEGRMKSPEYVFSVVSVYRAVLDRILSGIEPFTATPEEHLALSEAFSRGFSTAYLESLRGNEIMGYGRPNNRGVFIGRVSKIVDGRVEVALEMPAVPGDILEFWTNKGHFTYTLTDNDRLTDRKAVLLPDRAVGKGDRVFRVRSAAAAFVDDAFEPRISVDGRASVLIGQPLRVEVWPVSDPSLYTIAEGAVVEPARTRAVSAQDVRAHVDRLGQTPFAFNELDVMVDEGAGIGFSALHHVRAKALETLAAKLVEAGRNPQGAVGSECATCPNPCGAAGSCEDAADRRAPLLSLYEQEPQAAASHGCSVVAWVTNPACARAARKAGAEVLMVPALNYKRGESQLAGVVCDTPDQAGYPKRMVCALPTIDHEPIPGTREHALSFDAWRYAKEEKAVYADNWGDALRAAETGCEVEVGSHVPITNAQTLDFFARLGFSRAWLSPELTLGQIDVLAERSPIPLGVTVYGYQELMVCEHCLLMSQGPCNQDCTNCPRRRVAHHLHDRKGFDFPVITDALGRSHLYNGIALDAIHVVPDLVMAGISAVMVDTTMLDAEQTAKVVGRCVRARDAALSGRPGPEKPRGTTTGHLFRGVS